jgi:UDP-glucose 4-epimerase
LGTGKSTSILDLVRAFENASGCRIEKIVTQKRPEDLPIYYVELSMAKNFMGWSTKRTLD